MASRPALPSPAGHAPSVGQPVLRQRRCYARARAGERASAAPARGQSGGPSGSGARSSGTLYDPRLPREPQVLRSPRQASGTPEVPSRGPSQAPLGGKRRGPGGPCSTAQVCAVRESLRNSEGTPAKSRQTSASPFPSSALLIVSQGKTEQSLRGNRRTVPSSVRCSLGVTHRSLRADRKAEKQNRKWLQKGLVHSARSAAAGDCGARSPWQWGLNKTGLSLHARQWSPASKASQTRRRRCKPMEATNLQCFAITTAQCVGRFPVHVNARTTSNLLGVGRCTSVRENVGGQEVNPFGSPSHLPLYRTADA